jgi:hypothetical protein
MCSGPRFFRSSFDREKKSLLCGLPLYNRDTEAKWLVVVLALCCNMMKVSQPVPVLC